MNHTEIFAGQLKALAHTEKTCSFAFFFFFFLGDDENKPSLT